MTLGRSTRVVGCAAVLALAPVASGQTYPVRPIRVVVPQQAGGSADATLRFQVPHLESRLGKNVIVETFNIRAGTSLMHVPYKGVPAIINAALSGEVDVLFINPLTVLPHVKSGRLRVLGYTGSSRLPAMPEVPTVSESGLAGFDNPQASWHGWFAPAKTPEAIVMTIYAAVQEALRQSRVRGAIEAGGYRVEGGYAPAEFRKHIESELKRIAEVAHAARISTR